MKLFALVLALFGSHISGAVESKSIFMAVQNKQWMRVEGFLMGVVSTREEMFRVKQQVRSLKLLSDKCDWETSQKKVPFSCVAFHGALFKLGLLQQEKYLELQENIDSVCTGLVREAVTLQESWAQASTVPDSDKIQCLQLYKKRLPLIEYAQRP